jgi:hypothetical protein
MLDLERMKKTNPAMAALLESRQAENAAAKAKLEKVKKENDDRDFIQSVEIDLLKGDLKRAEIEDAKWDKKLFEKDALVAKMERLED